MDKVNLIKSFLAAAVAGGIALSAHGASVVEPLGLLSENYTGSTKTSSAGTAAGLSGAASVYGSPYPQTWTFTPGVDADNFSPSAGDPLGDGLTASGIAGGGSGAYNVYFTVIPSTNVTRLATFSITDDNGTQIWDNKNLNNAGTTTDGVTSTGEFNNQWGLLGTITLTAGTTYTVTQDIMAGATVSTWVGSRASGMMFEPIPEPSTYAAIFGGLALLGAFVYRRRTSVKK